MVNVLRSRPCVYSPNRASSSLWKCCTRSSSSLSQTRSNPFEACASPQCATRADRFNLEHFSFIPTYDPEDVIAYEPGCKGQMFDGAVQLNASMYLHEYDDIHLQFDTFSFTGVITSVQNAPSARTIGGELEGLWLVTDNLTVGVNYSFTDAEYNEELVEPLTGTRGVVDGNNATSPASIFTVTERNLLIDGQPLPQVPRHKGTGWAEYVQSLGNRGRLTYITSIAWTDGSSDRLD